MEVNLRKSPREEFLNCITLGLADSLKSYPNVCDVKLEAGDPVDKMDIHAWEQLYMCILPSDLKNFLMCCDGINLIWSYRQGLETFSLGHLKINGLEHLKKMGCFLSNTDRSITLEDIESDIPSTETLGMHHPTFNSKFKLFELDYNKDSGGYVCLVYQASDDSSQELVNPSIWYLDRALDWHFLAHTFTAYFRLMLAHLGLPYWQEIFTPYGLPENLQKWYRKFAPLHMYPDEGFKSKSGFIVDTFPTPTFNVLDVVKLFEGKA